MENLEMRKAQKEEAIRRMKMLSMNEPIIDAFKEKGQLSRSEFNGFLYWLNPEEQKMVEDWENETDYMVFHVIKDHFQFGLCYTFLFVSTIQEDWEAEREDLDEGILWAYVVNKDCPECSEYGMVRVKPSIGGLVRTE